MSGSPYGQHVRSLYLESSRPTNLYRQRSNSLPPNSFLANATEVGMMFSAAEKATARRKRTCSVDYSSTVSTPFDTFLESNIFPEPPSHGMPKPSPLRQVTTIRQSLNKPLPPNPQTPVDQIGSFSLKKNAPSAIELPEAYAQQLPVSPLSPKRQVASPSLKSYADSLLQFTHNRLVSTIPVVTVTSPTYPELDGLASLQSPRPRPVFESKFSDWSTTNNSTMPTPSGFDFQAEASSGLMSPDSFFGAEPTTTSYPDNLNSGVSFASSGTFEMPDIMAPPTPPEDDQEISYFTNFDKFLDQDTWPVPGVDAESPLNSVIIDLSPMDKSPPTPSDQILKSLTQPTLHPRHSAATIIRRISASAPLLSSGIAPCSVTPMNPIHIADVAVRVPNCWIGAVG